MALIEHLWAEPFLGPVSRANGFELLNEWVTPIQINAGTAMGEATSMQGALPLLVGAGGEIWKGGKWAGASQPVKDMLDVYTKIYGGGLGDPKLQQEAKGRDKSFEEFAAGNPIPRLGQPADVCHAVAFLASDGAEWITGQVVAVNGGALT